MRTKNNLFKQQEQAATANYRSFLMHFPYTSIVIYKILTADLPYDINKHLLKASNRINILMANTRGDKKVKHFDVMKVSRTNAV